MTDWLDHLAALELQHPWLLLLALASIALWLLHLLRGAAALRFAPFGLIGPRHHAAAYAGGAQARALPRTLRSRLTGLPMLLDVLGLTLVALAWARPVERVQLPLEKQGIDVLLCLDASSSMEAGDLDPQATRLDVARDAAGRFLAARDADRIGLVRFSAYPDLVCPPTLDHTALRRFLDEVASVEADSPEDLTGIGGAVARAAQVLRTSTAPSKVIILLTDGEENVARGDTPDQIAPDQAARLCREFGARVYTIQVGVGATGGPRAGQPSATVPIDTGPVKRLAESTGGAFFTAGDADALRTVFGAIDELETAEFADPRFEIRERFLPFLLAGLLLGLLARGLGRSLLGVLS